MQIRHVFLLQLRVWLLLMVLSISADAQDPDPLLRYAPVLVPVQIRHAKGNQSSFGTGFLLRQIRESDTTVYLVTAKHVLRDPTRPGIASRISLVLLARQYRPRWEEFPLVKQAAHQTVFFHPDPAVDLALVRLPIHVEHYHHLTLEVNHLFNKAQLHCLLPKLSPLTDSAFSVGFQIDSLLENRFCAKVSRGPLPEWEKARIVGKGKASSLNRKSKQATYLLSQFELAKGNSGSPVFLVFHSVDAQPLNSAPLITLAGIVSSVQPTYQTQNRRPNIFQETVKKTRLIPVYQILEVLPR